MIVGGGGKEGPPHAGPDSDRQGSWSLSQEQLEGFEGILCKEMMGSEEGQMGIGVATSDTGRGRESAKA